MDYWKRNDYDSTNISLDSSSDEEEEDVVEEVGDDGDEGVELRYLVGDVTHPQCAGSDDAIVVHCVGE